MIYFVLSYLKCGEIQNIPFRMLLVKGIVYRLVSFERTFMCYLIFAHALNLKAKYYMSSLLLSFIVHQSLRYILKRNDNNAFNTYFLYLISDRKARKQNEIESSFIIVSKLFFFIRNVYSLILSFVNEGLLLSTINKSFKIKNKTH